MGYASGARVTLLAQWLRLAIQLIGFVVLGRLLAPSDFGLIAMVAAIMSFTSLLADFGLSIAAVQVERLSRAQSSTLFFLNCAAGAAGTVILIALAPLLAAFYAEPRVAPISVALSVSMLFTSCAVQFRVELNRAGRFSSLAVQEVAGALTALTVAVLLSCVGAGYWALVAQAIVQPLCILVLAAFQARWWPVAPAPISSVLPILSFGGTNFLLSAVNLMSRTVDQMMVGRAQGPSELGLYSRASQLLNMIFQQIVAPLTRITVPMLARVSDVADFNSKLRKLHLVTSYGLLGALSLSAAVAEPGLGLLLGDGWGGAASIYRIMCLGAAFSAVGYAYYWASLARARSALLATAELPGRLVMIVGAVLLAPLGSEWVAAVVSLGLLISYIVASFTVSRAGVDVRSLTRASVRPLAFASFTFIASFVCQHALQTMSLSALIVGGTIWFLSAAALLGFKSYRRDLSAVLQLVRR